MVGAEHVLDRVPGVLSFQVRNFAKNEDAILFTEFLDLDDHDVRGHDAKAAERGWAAIDVSFGGTRCPEQERGREKPQETQTEARLSKVHV